MIKPLSKITAGEMQAAIEKLKQGDLIFRGDFSGLAKHFLGDYLPVNVFEADFPTLRSAYMEAWPGRSKRDRDAVPLEEQKFYEYICDHYLWLKRLPKNELAALYEQAIGDLKEVDSRLADISKELNEIHARNDASEVQGRNPVLHFFKEHNERARQEIMDFLLHGIKPFAVNRCYDKTGMGSFLSHLPYTYAWSPAMYEVQVPDDLDNKFRSSSLKDIRDLKKMYLDDKPQFYEFLHKYISDEAIVFSLNGLLNTNHILDARKEIITEALNVYETGAKIMFASAVPTIIEGILHDLCLQVGEPENELLQKGFQHKLDRLWPVLDYELHYEYYAFRFRLFRNKVAHGRVTVKDVEDLADFLLLDLEQICELTNSMRLPVNQLRFAIDQLAKQIDSPDFKHLIEYIHLSGQELPAFYGLDAQIRTVEGLIDRPEFWNYLDRHFANGDEVVMHGVAQTVALLKSQKRSEDKCRAFFKKAKIGRPNKVLAAQYLENLRRWY